ncbi:MAG: helix-turn-helix domain-containing protein [Planctomycetota bacterium]
MPRATLSKTVIAKLLESSPRPAYLLDDRRKIVFANQALADWLGVDKVSLANLQCDYHSQSPASSEKPQVQGLAVPPAAYEGRSLLGTIHRQKKSDDSDGSLNALFWPIEDEKDNVTGVLTLVTDGNHDLSSTSRDAHHPQEIHAALARLRARFMDQFSLDRLVGKSASIQRIREQVTLATQCSARVLIAGPKGSGSARIARTIHSARTGNPALIPLDCAVNDAEMLRDSLTSFIRSYAELETDVPPSLMLANVDQLQPEAQKELAGFLAIDELGLQTLAVSNMPFQELLDAGFRSDLATRLSAILIEIPALATRKEDIPQLVQAIVEKHNLESDHQLMGFEEEAIDQLVAYPWPGNEDELEKVVLECARKAEGAFIVAESLPSQIRLGMDAVLNPVTEPETIDLEEFLVGIERDLIGRAMKRAKGVKAEAARMLGISRNKLLRKLSSLGLDE